jgi:hypothetical protein
MAKLSIILYSIQFICPFVLGLEVKVNDVDLGKKGRAEKLCEFFLSLTESKKDLSNYKSKFFQI